MIELLVAIFVIVTGIVAVLALSIITITAARESIMQVEAVNLAREGIEVVRSIRDSNWLSIQAGELSADNWDDGLYLLTDYEAVSEFYPVDDPDTSEIDAGKWELNYDAAAEDQRLKILTDGTYVHFQYTVGEPTGYYRNIITLPICEDESVISSGACSDSGQEKIGIKVTSTVTWQEPNRTNTTAVEEDIYNWRP